MFLQRGIILKEGVTTMERALFFVENPHLTENYCITNFGKMPKSRECPKISDSLGIR